MIGALLAGLKNSETPDIFRELAQPAGLLGIATTKDIETGRFTWEKFQDDLTGNFCAIGSYTLNDKKYALNIEGKRNASALPGIQDSGSVTVTDESGTLHVISASSSGAQYYFDLVQHVVKSGSAEDRTAGQQTNPAER